MSAPEDSAVDDSEDLYRALTEKSWYRRDEGRISSAAFAYPRVSTDIVSIADGQGMAPGDFTLSHFKPGTGLVRVNAGEVKQCGGAPRFEPEAGNPAHAHIYMPSGSNRKRTQKKLADRCRLIREPNIPAS